LDHHALIRAQRDNKSHATSDAARNGHLDIVKEIVARDPGVIEIKGFTGRTPLLTAAQNGQLMVCKYLLIEKNANVNAPDDNQSTALILAAGENHTSVVELLLKNSAKNLKNKGKKSAIDHARQKNNVDMIKLLNNYFGEI
jgi:ankyrin repeat protein